MDSELQVFINEQMEKNKYHTNDMPSLGAVVTYDGNIADIIIQNKNIPENIKIDMLKYGKYSCFDNGTLDSSEKLTNDHAFYCPVCFIYSLDELETEAIYPCNPELLDVNTRYEYCLENSHDGIKRYIKVFYHSTENYFNSEPRKDLECNRQTASALKKIHSQQSVGDQEHIIYIKFISESQLANALKCVILPEKLLLYCTFDELKSRENIRCITYETKINRHPALYNQTVLDLLEQYFMEVYNEK